MFPPGAYPPGGFRPPSTPQTAGLDDNRMIEPAFAGNLSQEESRNGEVHVVYSKVQLQQGTTKAVRQQAATVATGIQSAAQGVQQAAVGVNAGLRAGTIGARNWVAPQLDGAADYVTSTVAPTVSAVLVKTVAPRVSAALRTTARQVSAEPPRSPFRSALTWTALSATVLAAVGAAGMLAWRRYRAVAAAESEPGDATRAAGTDAVTAETMPREGG
jgi:hypothetical protein